MFFFTASLVKSSAALSILEARGSLRFFLVRLLILRTLRLHLACTPLAFSSGSVRQAFPPGLSTIKMPWEFVILCTLYVWSIRYLPT
jgi:hypothetical protein